MPEDCRPIGFFDSGVGGISVLKTAFLQMPGENYIYYGDSANAPYGTKTEAQIKKLSLDAGRFLYERGVKAIVMACNTATSAAVILMREKYNIPVISMEPAVRPALAASETGKVLVLATPATVSQSRYLGLLERLDADGRVINVGCGGLVELIENGKTAKADIHAYLERKLEALAKEDVRSAVLGCTHYSFVEKEIASYLNHLYRREIGIFDGRHGTVRQLARVLEARGQMCGQTQKGTVTFHTSGDKRLLRAYRSRFKNFSE